MTPPTRQKPSKWSLWRIFKEIPLQTGLIVPFIILMTLAVGLVAYFSFRSGQQAVNQVTDQLLGEITRRIETHLTTFLTTPLQINQLNAAAIRNGMPGIDQPAALEHRFWEQIGIFKTVTSIYAANPQGGLINSGREGASGARYIIATDGFTSGPFRKFATDHQGHRTDLLVTVPDFDARTRKWYTGAVENKTAFRSPIYILFTGQDMAVASSLPVYDAQQTLLGVVSVDLFLSHINDFLKELTIGKAGHAFIVDHGGLLVASSDNDRPFIGPDEAERQRRLNATESHTPLIKEAAGLLSRYLSTHPRLANRQKFEFAMAGQRQFMQVTPMHFGENLDWLIAVVVPEADFMAEIIANHRITALFITVTLLGVILIGVFTSGKIANPILSLNTAALELAKGQWDKEIPTNSRFAEIKTLTQSFNRMAAQLLHMLRSLNTEIAERKEAENTLRLSEEKYRILVENANDAIIIAQDGTINFANQRTEQLTGYSRQELGRIAFTELIHPEDQDMVAQRHQRRLRGENPANSYDFRIIGKTGSQRTVQINSIRIDWQQKPATLSFIRDITQEKELEDRLHQSQKLEAIGTLAGGIAHDFNNLLMGIQGRTSLMTAELGPDHPQLEHIQTIEEYIRSATHLTRQLLGMARGGKYEVKPLDINQLLLESATMFGRAKKEIRIHTRFETPPPVVEADQRQIEQVLLNLYVNAWQAMAEGGELYLATRTVFLQEAFCAPHEVNAGAYVKISVTDTGTGMDKAVRERIFDPFFTTKEKSRGTGLGLASAYGIVKNHAGIITVTSDIGKGTTFDIYLPLSDKQAHQEASSTEEIRKGTETILLVDDEKMITEVAMAMLKNLGYTVFATNSGTEAIDCLREKTGEIDLVILDLIMPGMDGSETLSRIREIDLELPVILSSGYALDEQADALFQKGCAGFIQKPFTLAELARIIRRILDKTGQTQATEV